MEAEGEQKAARRLVKVRKRKILPGHSIIVTRGIDKENAVLKRARTEPEPIPPCVEPALDWGLKTKVRLLSPHSFDWAKVKRVRQESQGLAAFIQGHTDTLEPVCELRSLLHYWEHPSIPSLSLFAEDRHRLAIAGPLKDTAFTDSLKEDWSTSFRSLFQLFRLGTCSHFYLCTSTLTILFLTSDPGSPQAVISPTTSGFRRALNREGVEFSIPLNTSQPVPDEGPHENESDDECSSWIDSVIGAERRAVTKTTIKSSHQSQPIDSRPESTVLVSTTSLQSLFNYLLNCKTLISPTGSLAGVPPTLIAPVAFQGATLRTLKASIGSLSEQSGHGLIKKHYMDIVGPLLPHTLRQLRALLDRAQQELVVHTVESSYTSAFTRALQDI